MTTLYFTCPTISTSLALATIPALHINTDADITTIICPDVDPITTHEKLIDLATKMDFYADIIQPHQINRYLSLDNEFQMSQNNRNLEDLFRNKWAKHEQ